MLIGLLYLWWRSSTVGAGTLLLLSLPLLAIEAWSLLELGLLTAQGWQLPPSDPRPDAGRSQETVDIAIIAAGVEPDGLEQTLLACRAVRSRGRLVVIDDERRYRVRSLASDVGAVYHIDRRAREAPGLAAHRNTTSDRYVWLEAGQLPLPDLIEVTGPRFDRDDVAVCQLATNLLNRDDLAHLGRERDDDTLVNQVLGPALSRWDAGPWLGSASVVRRSAIDGIGGFDRTVPIERLVARLHRDGWATTFERRRLVAVTAPEAIEHYLAARRQRAGAALSVLLSTEGPLLPGGSMGIGQRLAHLGAAVRYSTGIRYLALSAVVVATLLTGVFPAEGGVLTLATFGAMAAGAGALGRRSIARGSMARGDWIRQGWRVIGAEAAAVIDAVTGRVQPIPVERRRGPSTTGLRALAHLPLLDLVVLAIDLALVARAVTIVDRDALPAFSTGQRVAAIGFALVVLVPIGRVLQVTVVRQQRRDHHRIPVALEATVDGTPATTVDVTPEGAGVLLPFGPEVGATTSLEISLPGIDGVTRRIVGRALVRSARPDDNGGWRAGLEITQLAPAARHALLAFCANQPIADEVDEADLAPAVDPVVAADERRRRSVRRATMGAGLAGLATVVFGPGVATASSAEPGLVEQVCVVDVDGVAVIDVVVERMLGEATVVLGATDLTGCIELGADTRSTGFAVLHRGARHEAQPGEYRGAAIEVALVPWQVRVVDLDAQPVATAEVRFFTDRWLRGLEPTGPADGHRFDGLPIDPAAQQIEVRLDGARHVVAMGDGRSRTVILPRVRLIGDESADPAGVTEGETAPGSLLAIDRGRGWEPLVDGTTIVPGPTVFRLGDGRILRLDVPESHEVLLPDGLLVPIEVERPADPSADADPDADPNVGPTPTPTSEIEPDRSTTADDPSTTAPQPPPEPTPSTTIASDPIEDGETPTTDSEPVTTPSSTATSPSAPGGSDP